MSRKVDPADLKEVTQWMTKVLGKQIEPDAFPEDFKSGVLLCELANALKPGAVGKYNKKAKLPFHKMENINNFIDAARSMGVLDRNNFVTVDLHEEKNLASVVRCLLNLKRELGFGFEKKEGGGAVFSYEVDEAKATVPDVQRSNTAVSGNPGDVSRIGSAQRAGNTALKAAQKCPTCAGSVTGGNTVAYGKVYHTKCFTCKRCDKVLGASSYYDHKNKPYCGSCIYVVNPQHSVKAKTGNKGSNLFKR